MITRTGLIDGEQTLRIFYPADDIRPASLTRTRHGNSSTMLRLRDDGRFDGKNNEGRRVRISNDASFEAFRSYFEYLPRGKHVVEYTVRLNNPGRFALPPTRVEAMYAPESFGEAPNAAIEVGP